MVIFNLLENNFDWGIDMYKPLLNIMIALFVVMVVGLPKSANSATFNLNVVGDLSSPSAVGADFFVVDTPIDPISIEIGDIINVNYTFANGDKLRILNAGAFGGTISLGGTGVGLTGAVVECCKTTSTATLIGATGFVDRVSQTNTSDGNTILPLGNIFRSVSLSSPGNSIIFEGISSSTTLVSLPPALLTTLRFQTGTYFTEVVPGSMSAVPVPAALPLFGTGLAIMGFIGWRRKRKMVAVS